LGQLEEMAADWLERIGNAEVQLLLVSIGGLGRAAGVNGSVAVPMAALWLAVKTPSKPVPQLVY